MQQLASVVDSCAVSNEAVVPPFTWYEWDSFFNRTFKFFRGISKYHHFRFTTAPGIIFVKVSPTAEEERISLLKPNVDLENLSTSMPNVLNPGGLSAERKLYLYRHVRPFCDDFKDTTNLVCKIWLETLSLINYI